MHPRSLPKVFFHIAVGSILLFGPGLFLTWALALAVVVMKVEDATFRTWARRLILLAAFDTVLVFSFIGVAAEGVLGERSRGPGVLSPDRPVIGMNLEEGPGNEVRVAAVVPDGPAARAGFEPGDVLVEIDERPVTSASEARRRVADVPPGEPVRIRRSRKGTQAEVEVTPVPSGTLRPPARGLFDPTTPSAQCLPFQTNPTVPWSLLVGAAVVGGLWWLGRRRGMDATLLWCGALLAGTSMLTQAAAVVTCLQVGGPSRGGVLVALAVQTVAFVVGGGWLARRTARWAAPAALPVAPAAETDGGATLPVLQTCLLGALFLVCGGVRLGALLTVALKWAGTEGTPYDGSIVHELALSGLTPGGALLFVAVVAVLGPIGEELVFRGVVLPWLARWMTPLLAIGVSGTLFGALHLFYGPFVLVAVYYGWVLGWARVRSGGLVAPIALHIAINGAVSAVLLGWAARGG